MSTPDYDAWLEAPYQRELAEAERYEAALDAEESCVRARLEALTVSALLAETDSFEATPNDLLLLSTREALPPAASARWSLDAVISVIATAEARYNLANAEPDYDDGDYGPDDLDFYHD